MSEVFISKQIPEEASNEIRREVAKGIETRVFIASDSTKEEHHHQVKLKQDFEACLKKFELKQLKDIKLHSIGNLILTKIPFSTSTQSASLLT